MMALDQLRELKYQLPAMNEQAASRSQAATEFQLGRELGRQPGQVGRQLAPSQAQLSQAAGAQAAQRAQIEAGARTQTREQQQAQGALLMQRYQLEEAKRLQGEQLRQRQQLAGEMDAVAREERVRASESKGRILTQEMAAQRALSQFGMYLDNNINTLTVTQREQLAQLGGDLQHELNTQLRIFEGSERQRRFSNARQLEHYNMSAARSEAELQGRMSSMELQSRRRITVLRQSAAELQDVLRRGYLDTKGDLDNRHRLEIAELLKLAEDEANREKSRAAARAGRMQAGMTIFGTAAGAGIGAVVGTFAAPGVGTAAGAQAGAMIGAGVGGAAGQYMAGRGY